MSSACSAIFRPSSVAGLIFRSIELMIEMCSISSSSGSLLSRPSGSMETTPQRMTTPAHTVATPRQLPLNTRRDFSSSMDAM